jgi:hypothetical protein
LVANSWKLWLNGCMTTFIVIHNIWVLALFSNIVAFKWEFYVWKHKVYKYNLTTPNPFPNMYIYYYEQDFKSTWRLMYYPRLLIHTSMSFSCLHHETRLTHYYNWPKRPGLKMKSFCDFFPTNGEDKKFRAHCQINI